MGSARKRCSGVVLHTFIFSVGHPIIVTFFIDGAGLLAKENPRAFMELVDKTKHFANYRTLQIIFVNNEEHVLPLLRST